MAEKKDSGAEAVKHLYRSKIDRIFAGVCGGFAEYFNIDVIIVRVIMLVLFFFKGFGILLYLICLVVMKENPQQSSADQKKPQNTALYWGIGLVLLGLFLLPHWRWEFWNFHPFRWYWFDFWPFDWDRFWPIIIILFGVLYLIHVLRQKKKTEEAEEEPVKLFRSRSEKVIGGVCGGIAKNLKVDPVIVRIGWVLLSLVTKVLLGIVVYILWMIFIPEESDESETAPEAKAPSKPTPKRTVKRVKKLPEKGDQKKEK